MGYRLVGHKYQEIPLTNTNKRWSEELELYLGVKEGKLRYFAPDGKLVPTPQETALQEIAIAEQETLRAEQEKHRADEETLRAEQETLRAEQEKHRADEETLRAEQEKHRADTLASYLRSLGINPEEIA
jgi:hypothetical protein